MATNDEPGRWTVFGERTLYDNPWVRLTKVDVQPPGGERFEHHVVRLQRVAVALVLDGDRVLMMWRHRFVTDQWGWELPGGIVEDDEDGPRGRHARLRRRPAGVREICVTL